MDPISEFRAAVAEQFRCRQAETEIMPELLGHIEDHAEALISRGLTQEEAEVQAVAAMGDPSALGKALDALHSPWWYRAVRTSLVLSFAALGIAAVLFFVGFLPDGNDRAPLIPTVTAEEALNQYIFSSWNGERTDITVLAKGTVTGGGKLRDYTFTPVGEAVVFRCQWQGEELEPTLCFLISTWHWRPWQGDFYNAFPNALSGTDGMGRTWAGNRIAIQPDGGGGSLWGYQLVTASGVDPGAQTFDVTLDLYGESLSFHVALKEGDGA